MIQHLNKLFFAIIILSIFTYFQRPDYNLPLFVFALMLWSNSNVPQKLRLWYLIVISAIVDIIWIMYWTAVWSGFVNRQQVIGNFTIMLSVLILIIKLAIIVLSFLKVQQCSQAISSFPANIKSIINGPTSSQYQRIVNNQQDQRSFVKDLETLRNYIFYNFLGGPKIIPVRYTINTFKGLTFAWVICLMIIFQNFSRGMYVYLFLHGTYGIAWLYKDIMFGDATFKQKGTFGSNLIFAIFLLVYWMIPLPLAMGAGISNPSLLRIILVVSLYIFGLILMLGSDYQKTTTLAERKGLISTGFFKLTRNPNYLGESMIYGSFAICSGHIISYLIFILGSGTLFTINIYLKDKLSYQKKQGWKEYSQQSYIFLPKIFSSILVNIIFYGIILIIIGYIAFFHQIHELKSQ